MKYTTTILWVGLLIFLISPAGNNNDYSYEYHQKPEPKREIKIELFEDIKFERKQREERRTQEVDEIEELIGVLTLEEEE